MSTSFSTKCEILSEVHLEASWNEQLKDFSDVHDIGLPLAYLVTKELATTNDKGEAFIEATWESLCEMLGVDSKATYTSADEILDASPVLKEDKEDK